MISKKDVHKKIVEISTELKLPGIRKYYIEEVKDSVTKDLDYESFLLNLLEKEFDLRQENGKTNRIRSANFPYKSI